MTLLLAGLLLFLGSHLTRVVANDWRTSARERVGPGAWKTIYSVIAIAGLVLIVQGYGLARQAPIEVWSPPAWTRHVAALLMALAFILLAAAFVPGTHIKARVGHPMTMSVKVWAFAHLLSNGRLADIVLFGSFLAWAVLVYIAARRRDRVAGIQYPAVAASRDIIAVVVGLAVTVAFAKRLHASWIGVAPFG